MLDESQRSAEDDLLTVSGDHVTRWPLFVGLGTGIISALLTLVIVHSPSSLYGVQGFFVGTVLFPGFLGAMVITGNVHDFSLGTAAGINCGFYFLFVWMICSVFRRVLRRLR